jgi:Sulfotransferase family
MIRSGSTLIEQILASHPKVHAGGERKDFGEAMERVLAQRTAGVRSSVGRWRPNDAVLRRLLEAPGTPR